MSKRHVASKTISYQLDYFQQYKALSREEEHHVIFESGRGGRYHIIGLRPVAILSGKGDELAITEAGTTTVQRGNPIDLMQAWMEQRRTDVGIGLPFSGGAIGYFSYDCMRYIERIPTVATDDLHMPDVYFLVFDDVFVIDREAKTLTITVHRADEQTANEALNQYEAQWTTPSEATPYEFKQTIDGDELQVSMSNEQFVEAVERIKQYIGQGDIFQVNLSVRQSKPLQSHPFSVYESLREVNPSPYMGYFHTPQFQLVSGSPELLVKKAADEVSTRPIAGTRSRGVDDADDARIAKKLIENEKERAEHVMLVDLERNDLGRVCAYGTVEVNEFMVIEKYSHVMHIVSNVRGRLADGNDAFDCVRATFPGGTITGAPKIRTMEIIEELEPVRRGLYTGSLGWIGYNGDMELNISIRTLVAKDGMAHIQAGAGIVIDSTPQHEYEESLKKAAALWKAKQLSDEKLRAEESKA